MSGQDRTGDGGKPKWTPSVLELCVLALIIATAGWGLHSLGNMIESHLTGKREETIANLFQTLDYDISYRDISPSLLRAFEIRDLTISNRGSSDDPLVFIRHLRLHYSLSRLVINRDPVAALREIQLVDSDFTLDLGGEGGLGILLQALSVAVSGGDDSLGVSELPPMNLAGANLGVVIEGPGMRVELRELYFRVRAGERLRITASGTVAALLASTASPALLGNEFLETDFRITGSAAADFSSVDATVRIPELTTSSFAAGPLTLQVTADDDNLQIAKAMDRLPLAAQFTYDLNSGRTELRFEADDLQVADAAQFDASGPELELLQAAVVTGSGRWIQDPAAGMRYDGDFSARFAAAGGRPETEVVVAANGDGERLVVSRLDARLDQIGVQFVGDLLLDPISPQGDLIVTTAPDLLGGIPLNARLTLRRNGSGFDLRGDGMTLGDTAVLGFEANLSPAGTGQPRFRYRARMALEQDIANSITAEGVLDLRAGVDLGFAARFTDVAAGALYRLAASPDERQPWLVTTLEPLLVNAAVSGSTDFAGVQLGRSTVRVLDRSQRETRLRFQLDREQEDWLLDDLAAQWGGFRLQGDVRVTPAEESFEVAANFTVNDQPLFLQVTHRAGEGLTASGSHQLSLAADYAAAGISFRGAVTELPVPWSPDHPPLKTTMAFSGEIGESAEWSLRSDAVTFAGIPFLDRRGAELEFGIRASASGISLDPISLRDGESMLTGSGSVTYGGGPGAVAGRIALADAADHERISVSAALDQDNLDVKAEIRGVPLARIGEFPISGDVQANVTVFGPMQALMWNAAVNLENGRLNEEEVALAATVEVAPGSLLLDQITFDLLSHHLRNGTFSYHRDSARAQFDADYSADYFGDPVSAHLRLSTDDLDLGEGGSLNTAFATGVRAALHTSALQVAGAPLDDWQMQLVVANGDAAPEPGAPRTDLVVHFDGGPHEAFAGFISTLGQFQVHVRGEPYPLRGTATGSISSGVIAADVDLEEADARVINEVLGDSPISVEAGRVSGTARVEGPLNDPDFWGQLRVTGGSVTSLLSPQVVGPFTVVLTLEEKALTISGFASETGAALPVTVVGAATVERWVPATYRLELATTSASGIAIDHQFGPLQFDGYAMGAVTVAGASQQVSISGRVQAVQGDIAIAEVAAGGGRADPLEVDLAVTTGRSVEFTWPTAQFPILRVMLVPSEEVRIGYDGLAGSFSVDGAVDVRSGDLFYFNRQFRLREGRIGFSENETRFDPQLEVHAETRERDANGDPVRIMLDAETSFSQFSPETVRLASDPPQSALALDALLRDPLAGENADVTGGAGVSAAAFSGDLLAQVALLQPVERALREALGVDMVSIRSPFVQNLVLDGLAAPTEDGSEVTVGNPLDNTSLSFGKYLGSDLFLTMLLRLDTPGDSSSSEPPLLSDIELSLEWATPFFMLEWSFLPRDANTLFVTDNAITLRWGWRY